MQYEDRTVVAVGYFDGVHIGHRSLFQEVLRISRHTGMKPVALTFDFSSVRPRGKGPKDLYQREESFRIMESLGITPVPLDFGAVRDLTPIEFVHRVLIRQQMAGHVVSSSDFRFGKDRMGGVTEMREVCAGFGIGSTVVDEVMYGGRPVSTTRIKELVANGEMSAAGIMLGAPYRFTAEVVRGKGLGRQIGFPTMNQVYPSIVRPAKGVYESIAEIDGIEYHSVTDIGVRPTVEDVGEYRAETHVIGIDEDEVGKTVRVSLLRRLRDEKKFMSVEELKKAIDHDVREVMAGGIN
ncbi:MAG: riboflavin kinase [Oscillospiraceae bacterium]|jgi:riboflavin kinase/FMN adenylyltransferase